MSVLQMHRRRMVEQQRGFATQAQQQGGKRQFSFYDTFMKTNSRYLMFVISGAALGEFMFGFVGDLIWDLNNRGVSECASSFTAKMTENDGIYVILLCRRNNSKTWTCPSGNRST